MKKVTDLWEKEVIHCPTLEEAEAICKLMHEAGLEWWTWSKYIDVNSRETRGENTCYYVSDWSYGNIKHFQENWYTIHKASDFLGPTKKRHSYKTVKIREDWLEFTKDTIWGKSIEDWKKERDEHKSKAKEIDSQLIAHANLFRKR